MFLTYALRKTFFRLSLIKAKVVPLPKSADKKQTKNNNKFNQLQTNITSVCFVKASRKACAHLLK